MERKIKEVQEYFTAKILADEFEIITKGTHVWEIRIDEKYVFEIWMANIPEYRNPHGTHGNNFMSLPFTEEQSIRLDGLLKERFKKWKREVLLPEKLKELEILNSQLGE